MPLTIFFFRVSGFSLEESEETLLLLKTTAFSFKPLLMFNEQKECPFDFFAPLRLCPKLMANNRTSM